ncbi:Sir2 histone deacetylase Hst2 [Paramarasmius palmivorus]|uniref:NAD-dependent protein deacetylase n=1 Tax=Paramarasmius palmivorus TaxID=297713 RepID=A0AAW0CHX6_9AGAR
MSSTSPRKGSKPFQRTPPKILERNDLPSLAKYMKSGKCKNVVLMLGAGVSTSAGIPDFRSPGTGLYANLSRLNLPYPEAVFEINFFKSNPVPFYTLANELYPGRFRPTPTHSFIRLLDQQNLLSLCLTQNIDTLERRAGVPEEKIVEAHGSFATQRCVTCKKEFDSDKMKEIVWNFEKEKKIPKCDCGGLVKPDIVFFGEQLPPAFFSSVPKVMEADLLIVIGTSLTVHPFASLAMRVHPYLCPRVLINLDQVGDFGTEQNDVILLGKCDDVVQELCRELGWEDELNQLWEETKNSLEVREGSEKEEQAGKSAESEVDELAKKLALEMALSDVTKGIEDKQSETLSSHEKENKGVHADKKSDVDTEQAACSETDSVTKEEPAQSSDQKP